MSRLKRLFGLEKPRDEFALVPSTISAPRWNPDEQEIWDKLLSYPVADWTETIERKEYKTETVTTYRTISPVGSAVSLIKRVHVEWEIDIAQTERREITHIDHRFLINDEASSKELNIGNRFVVDLFDKVAQRVTEWKRTDLTTYKRRSRPKRTRREYVRSNASKVNWMLRRGGETLLTSSDRVTLRSGNWLKRRRIEAWPTSHSPKSWPKPMPSVARNGSV